VYARTGRCQTFCVSKRSGLWSALCTGHLECLRPPTRCRFAARRGSSVALTVRVGFVPELAILRVSSLTFTPRLGFACAWPVRRASPPVFAVLRRGFAYACPVRRASSVPVKPRRGLGCAEFVVRRGSGSRASAERCGCARHGPFERRGSSRLRLCCAKSSVF
jgi:hypothetical protein